MLFSISAIHSLAILATADHEPTCVEIGFTILCNSDIVLSASFLVEQKSSKVFLKCLAVSSEESIDLNCFSTSCLNPAGEYVPLFTNIFKFSKILDNFVNGSLLCSFCSPCVILIVVAYIDEINNKRIMKKAKKSYDKKLNDAMRFYLLATSLKYKIRSGWDETHWNVSKERIESIAEHVYGTCILALSIDSEFETNLDINKVVKMLVIHELGEVVIGDITPFDNITPEEKMEKEHEAIKEVLGDLIKKDEFYSLLLEFDDKKTKEAVFAHHCDKLEADIQAKVYQDMGCQHSLDEQENNVVFKSQRVQQMVKDGAKSAFDIWYEWDKSLYYDDEIFANILDHVKEINTQQDF